MNEINAYKARSALGACAILLAAALFSCAHGSELVMPGHGTPAPLESASADADYQDLEGSWDGFLSYMGQDLAIRLYFLREGGIWSGYLDIPPQNAFDMALVGVAFAEGALKATLPGQSPLAMEATLSDGALAGSFTQGPATGAIRATRSGNGASLRAALREKEAAEAAARDPNIVSREVSIALPGGLLYGTLSRPLTGAATVALLIIPGSGPTDRDGNSILLPGKNNSLLSLGNELVLEGFMVLRVDKRGVGKSVWQGLREEDLTIDQMASDAAAWLSYLRMEAGIEKVAAIGHSEGALVALLAAREARPEGLVLLAPLSADFFDTLFKQLAGMPEDYLRRARFIYEELKAGRYVSKVDADLLALFRPSVQPYMRSLIEHRPASLLAAQDTPTLVVAGGRDLQIELADAKALAAARPGVGFLLLDGMNHVLKSVKPELADNQAAYSQPSYPLAEGLVGGIAEFLRK
jgi:pimeloyl-ACP methyl ester carboxylesterase